MAKKEFEYEFNPIKEQKGNEQAQSVVWSTKSIEAAVDAIKKGLPLKVNPFIGNNTKLLKPELVFKRTDDEIEDYVLRKDSKIIRNYLKKGVTFKFNKRISL